MMRTFVALLAALSFAPISIAAHEGHTHKTMGVVMTYQQVKDKAGNVSTVVKTIQLGVTAAPVKS
jgi:hypothetical protein